MKSSMPKVKVKKALSLAKMDQRNIGRESNRMSTEASVKDALLDWFSITCDQRCLAF